MCNGICVLCDGVCKEISCFSRARRVGCNVTADAAEYCEQMADGIGWMAIMILACVILARLICLSLASGRGAYHRMK